MIHTSTGITIAIAILATFLTQLCATFLSTVRASSYFLPALALVCIAMSLGPANSEEIAAALALEYNIAIEDDEQPAESTNFVEPIKRPAPKTGVVSEQHQTFSKEGHLSNVAVLLLMQKVALSGLLFPVRVGFIASGSIASL